MTTRQVPPSRPNVAAHLGVDQRVALAVRGDADDELVAVGAEADVQVHRVVLGGGNEWRACP